MKGAEISYQLERRVAEELHADPAVDGIVVDDCGRQQ